VRHHNNVSSPTPPPTSTEVTPRPSVSSAASRPIVPKEVEEDEDEENTLPLPAPPKRTQKRTPMVYVHPLDAQQAYFEPCSRVLSLVALAIVVTVLLK